MKADHSITSADFKPSSPPLESTEDGDRINSVLDATEGLTENDFTDTYDYDEASDNSEVKRDIIFTGNEQPEEFKKDKRYTRTKRNVKNMNKINSHPMGKYMRGRRPKGPASANMKQGERKTLSKKKGGKFASKGSLGKKDAQNSKGNTTKQRDKGRKNATDAASSRVRKNRTNKTRDKPKKKAKKTSKALMKKSMKTVSAVHNYTRNRHVSVNNGL